MLERRLCSLVGKGAPEETVEPLTRDEAREALARALHERAEEERRRSRQWWDLIAMKSYSLSMGKTPPIYGSQGQQRSIVLSYKLAEAAVIEIIEQKPVLLLDDVMSELDGRRRDALVTAMEGGSQTFYHHSEHRLL